MSATKESLRSTVAHAALSASPAANAADQEIEKLFTIDGLADYTGLSKTTLWRYFKEGRIKCFHLFPGGPVRIRASEVRRFIDEAEAGQGAPVNLPARNAPSARKARSALTLEDF
jgi:excisionase family DNA binding protein